MASPPLPPSVDELGDRSFSFYPPIVNVSHNEWVWRQGNWSEILVWNEKAGIEVWIPRSYLGEISRTEEPVMIVGLRRELEYKGGTVWPHVRRVISMPAPTRKKPEEPQEDEQRSSEMRSAIQGEMRKGSGTELWMGKAIGATILIGVALTFLVVNFLRVRTTGGTVEYQSVLQADLGLNSQSDYYDVVRKLGEPESDKWKSELGERQYRALYYPKRDIIIILMGADRNSAHYIGAKDQQWRTIHSVVLPGGGSTDSIMRSLQKF